MPTDKERLKWLEMMANQPGGILLHDGSENGRIGLGLRPGTLARTLRKAIDDAMGAWNISEPVRSMTPAQLQDTTSLFRTTEEYCVRQDEFLAYCQDHVNPARIAAGLKPMDDRTACEAFRILDKFFMHWRRNGVTV